MIKLVNNVKSLFGTYYIFDYFEIVTQICNTSKERNINIRINVVRSLYK